MEGPTQGVADMVEAFRSARTRVSAGRAADGTAVVVKTPAAALPDAAEIARYRRERGFLDLLAGPGIPAVVSLDERDGTVRLVTRDRGGRSLAAWIDGRRLTVDEALGVLEEAAAILARVHAAGVIHRDVDPANLVWAGRPGTLELVDFGNSVREGESATPGRLEGTLRYIAPEATGRSGHAVTWRADLYGLGVTAWHLLVGRAPFEYDDPLALVHAHLARLPDAPHDVDATVPPCLSAVVQHLLEKDPERRYQSAEGLAADLRRCREGLARGDGAAFDLGRDDVPPRFAIPARLYARDADVAALVAAIEGTRGGGVSLAWVEGPSGIGKSALIAALSEPARRLGVRIVRGRFELLARDTPLKAVTEACEALLGGVLALDEGALAETRDRLRSALGDAAAVLARTLPSLRTLLGDAAAPEVLGGQAAAVRTMQGHAALLGALASASHPVVLVLDDLQWADAASTDLVEFLVHAPHLHGLLILGACRGDEVFGTSASTRMRERIAAAGKPITRVEPGALDAASTTALVADACRCPREVAAPLAEALHVRTGGNPFFVRTLLQQMHDRGLLRRDGSGWRWSAEAPDRLDFAANVVDAVLDRLVELPQEASHALGVAARIGHRFDVRFLALALDRADADVVAALTPAVAAGLLRPESEAWGLLAWGAVEGVDAGCRFVHDRVQEAALRLLPEDQAGPVHARLARLLTRDRAPTGKALFEALEHHRASMALLADEERLPVARLALAGSAEASRSAAFDVALRVCELGLEVAGRRDAALWESLCVRAVEIADASANDAAVERHGAALIAGASTVAATAPAYVARIRSLTRAERYAEAIDTANAFLGRLGQRVETRLRPLLVAEKLARVLWAVRGRTPEALVDGPEATDPTHVAAVSVRIATAMAVATAFPEAVPLDILTAMEDLLLRGATAEGLFAWTGWAMLIAEVQHRPELGARYCELAMARAERMGARAVWATIANVSYSCLQHWFLPLPEVALALGRTRERALESGDSGMALLVSGLENQIALYVGRPLADVDVATRQTIDLLRQYRVANVVSSLIEFRDVIATLRSAREHTPLPAPASPGGAFGELNHCTMGLLLAMFLGDRLAGWRAAREVPASLATPLRSPSHFVWWTYRAVALLRAAAAGHLAASEARSLVRPGRALLERWAKAVPGRRYRVVWIDAADAVLRGRHAEALALYEKAMDLARGLGVVHDAALLAEHAAEVAEASARPRLRSVFIDEAIAGYRQWGALGKAAALAATLPARASGISVSATTGPVGDLDLEALFRASVALASEIRLDRLLAEVVAVTMQNAGATRGFVVSEREGALVVEVGRSADGAELVAPGTPLAAVHALATTVVRYVARTGEQLVLADGAADPRFAADPYLQDGAHPSVLCAPLTHKGRRAGLIYLENDLVSGSFTSDRLRTVHVLAAQAAVSIQNAILVDTLEAKVEERTRALQQSLAQTRAQHQQLAASQEALIQSEKMAALGQLVAGVAHELNTPLGAIRASADNLTSAVESVLQGLLELLAETPAPRREEWVALVRRAASRSAPRTSREERATQRRVAAQLAATGVEDAASLSAMLTEIGLGGDDTAGALPSPELLRMDRRDELLRGAYDVTSIVRNGRNIRTAADRAAKIVFALKSYAHPGGADGESTRGALADDLDTVLTLYENQIKHHVDLVRDYEDPGVVLGRHDALNQVWTNLVHNALQAMDHKGRLEVSVRRDGDDALVSVIDSGPGIAASQLDRIFEPFFTTKAAGEGSGLGLSICRDIVEKHGGRIEVASVPGRTRFTVRLPRVPRPAPE